MLPVLKPSLLPFLRVCRWLLPGLLALASACRVMALYDPIALEHSTALKVEALALLDHASEPYPAHQTVATAVLLKANQALEYEKSRALNVESIKMWQVLVNPQDPVSLANVLRRWQQNGTLNAATATAAKGQLSDYFDYIIRLETVKLRKTN